MRRWFWPVVIGVVIVGIVLGEAWAILDPNLPTLTQWIITHVPWWAALLFGLWLVWHFGIRYARLPWGPLRKTMRSEVEGLAVAEVQISGIAVDVVGNRIPFTGAVRFELPNLPPIFRGITQSPDPAIAGQPCVVTIFVEDPEGGAITFESVTVSAGTISATATPGVYTWVPPSG